MFGKLRSKIHLPHRSKKEAGPVETGPAAQIRVVEEVLPGNINFFADGTYSTVNPETYVSPNAGSKERSGSSPLTLVVNNRSTNNAGSSPAPDSNLGDRMGGTFISHAASRAFRAVHRGFTRVVRGTVNVLQAIGNAAMAVVRAVGRFILAIPLAIASAIVAFVVAFIVVVRGREKVREFLLDTDISDNLRPAA
jgi:hypothetical protein